MGVEEREEEVVLTMGKGEEIKKYKRKNKRKRTRKGEVMNQGDKIVEKTVQKKSSGSSLGMMKADKVEAKQIRKTRGSTLAKETPVRKWLVRERKAVERFDRELGSMALFINKGKGMKLKDIPNVTYKLLKRKANNNLQMLHIILFQKKSKEKERAKLKQKIDKCVKQCLFDFYEMLDIPVSKETTKVELLAKLLEFLESLHATTKFLLARKKQSKRDNKRTGIVNIIKATSPEELAKNEGTLEECTMDDDVSKNKNHTDESKEQVDFLPEEDTTQVYNKQDTQGNKKSTEKHVLDSALKKKKATPIKKNPTSEAIIEKGGTGQNKAHADAQEDPSQEEILDVVSRLLKEVDFDIVNFANILKELEAHFNMNLSHRKAEMRGLIEEAILNMVVNEEQEEVEENFDSDANE